MCVHSTGSFNSPRRGESNEFIAANFILFRLPTKPLPDQINGQGETNCGLCAYYLSQIKWACKNFARAHKYFSIHS